MKSMSLPAPFRKADALRVGFDGTCLSHHRGFGRFARGMLAGLAATNPGHLLEVVADEPSARQLNLPAGVSTRIAKTRQSQTAAASGGSRRSLADMWSMCQSVHAAKYDIFYFPTTFTYFPQLPWRKVVVTMHDTMGLERPDFVFATRRASWLWRIKEQAARWNAALLTTGSESARQDLARYFRLSPDRIVVLTEGVEPVFLRPDQALSDFGLMADAYQIPRGSPFWLFVGELTPHKNLLRLIDAFARLPDDAGTLVLVGDANARNQAHVSELREKARALGVGERVVFTGFVPDEQLAVLYRHARALVLPSLWEGFGLPAVEAMAGGTPVLHSLAGSLPEVVGNAGLCFDPMNTTDIVEKWLQLAADQTLRQTLSGNAIQKAEPYRWEHGGRMLWSEFERLACAPPELSRG